MAARSQLLRRRAQNRARERMGEQLKPDVRCGRCALGSAMRPNPSCKTCRCGPDPRRGTGVMTTYSGGGDGAA